MAAGSTPDAHDAIVGRELLITILVIQAAVLTVASLTPNSSVPFDMTVYAAAANDIFGGGMPYRDFELEYPPVALAPILLPRLVAVASPMAGDSVYQTLFLLLMGGLSLTMTALIWALARRWTPVPLDPLRPTLYAVLLVALASPLLLWRFDLFPAVLTLVSLILVGMARPTAGGAVLALAIGAKLYPVVLVPVFLAAYLATRDRAGLRLFLLGLLGTLLLVTMGTLLVAPEAVSTILGYHLGRGVQLESTFGGLMQIAHLTGQAVATVTDQFDSLQIDSTWTGLVLAVQPVMLLLICVIIWVAAFVTFQREVAEGSGLSIQTVVDFLVAALLAFMLGSRVLSPQFVIWIMPFAPLLGRRTFAVVAIAFALTFLVFPYLYGGLIALEPLPSVLNNVRNVLLVALLVTMLYTALGPRTARRATSSMPAVTEQAGTPS